jgi:hypothetical protein
VQTWPDAHTVPQLPQWFGLLWTSTQLPLQNACPLGHAAPQMQSTHTPPRQFVPAGQTTPQAPQ